jgi:hypothetical protein
MNVYLLFHVLAPFLREKSLEDLFPPHLMNNFPYHAVQSYHCIAAGCDRRLSKTDVYFAHRGFPSAICSFCFSEMTANQSEECWVCGDYLEDWRYEMQKIQTQNINFRMHELRCRDYFSIVSVKALGQEMTEFIKK